MKYTKEQWDYIIDILMPLSALILSMWLTGLASPDYLPMMMLAPVSTLLLGYSLAQHIHIGRSVGDHHRVWICELVYVLAILLICGIGFYRLRVAGVL